MNHLGESGLALHPQSSLVTHVIVCILGNHAVICRIYLPRAGGSRTPFPLLISFYNYVITKDLEVGWQPWLNVGKVGQVFAILSVSLKAIVSQSSLPLYHVLSTQCLQLQAAGSSPVPKLCFVHLYFV